MFERYSEQARRTIFFARYEASQLGSERIETEHLLLGLLRENRELAHRYFGPVESGAEPIEEIRETPPEILQAEQRIESLVRLMEQAIAEQDFLKARAYSDDERRERVKLRQLREQRDLEYESAGLGGIVEGIRRRIEASTASRAKVSTSADLPLSHESKRAIAYAAEEAERMSHKRIGPEHLLLGLLREDNCLAAQILKERGLRLPLLRKEIGRRTAAEAGEAGGIRRPVGLLPRAPMPPGMSGWMAALQDAGRVLLLARHEAAQRNSACIETTDLLRALATEKEFQDRFPGPADSVRKRPRPAPEPRREKVSTPELPFSEDCKLALTLAAREAARLGQRTSPAHLLLGILGVESCAAAEVLRDCGLTAEGVRALLTPPPPPSDPQEGRSYV